MGQINEHSDSDSDMKHVGLHISVVSFDEEFIMYFITSAYVKIIIMQGTTDGVCRSITNTCIWRLDV